MLIAVLLLLRAVTSNSRTDRSQSALSTVLDSLAEVLELALRLLLLSGGVLLSAAATEALVADHVAEGFFGRAHGLVILAGDAFLVVLGHSAGVRVCREGADLGGCVGGFVLDFAFGFLGFTLVLWLLAGFVVGDDYGSAYLGGGVASHGAYGTLSEASSLVQVGLSS